MKTTITLLLITMALCTGCQTSGRFDSVTTVREKWKGDQAGSRHQTNTCHPRYGVFCAFCDRN